MSASGQVAVEHVETRAGRLAVRQLGAGRPVVFWPSIFMDGEMWLPLAERLSADYRCLLIDPPGHGLSDPLQSVMTLRAFARCCVDLLEAFRLGPVAFVGNSFGGMIALTLAAHFPDTLTSIAIMNSSARAATRFDRLYYRSLVPLLRTWGFVGPLPRIAERSLLGRTSLRTQPALRALIRAKLASTSPRSAALAGASVLIEREDQRDLLASISTPTLVIGGAEDVVFPAAHSKEIAAGIHGAKLHMLPGVGHFAPLEAPERVAQVLRSFLATACDDLSTERNR